jgi:hypothetical protein
MMRIQFPTINKEKNITNRRRRPIIQLVLGIVSLGLLGGLVYYYPPSTQQVYGYTISILPIFLLLLFSTLFFLGSFIFKSKSHGFLIATFTSIYLLFRLNNLTHPFFFILLFGLFVSLELFVSYRR